LVVVVSFLFFSFLFFLFSFSFLGCVYPHPFTINSKFFIYYFPSRISSTFCKRKDTSYYLLEEAFFWMILGGGE
jgi:hypothetical protein